MSLTWANVIDAARVPLNDTAKSRYTDAQLLSYGNDGVLSMVGLKPDMFYVIADIPCVAGTVDQEIPADGVSIVEIFGIKDGVGITRVDFDTLRSFRDTWRTDAADEAQNWGLYPQDPRRSSGRNFFVYPRAPSNQILTGQYVSRPVTGAIGDQIPVDDIYSPALQAYIIFRAESVDDEHVNSGRAALFLQAWSAQVGAVDATEKVAP